MNFDYFTLYKTGEDAAGGDVGNEIEPYPPSGGFRQNEHIPSDRQVTAPVGTRAELRCRIENSKFQRKHNLQGKTNDTPFLGPNDILINWRRADNGSLPEGSHVSDGILYIDNIQPEATGEYVCYGIDRRYNVISFKDSSYNLVVTSKWFCLFFGLYLANFCVA